mgnify:CR=1 FL=1
MVWSQDTTNTTILFYIFGPILLTLSIFWEQKYLFMINYI